MEDLPVNQPQKKYRGSVSAEVITGFSAKPKADTAKKSEAVYNQLLELMKKCFIFKTVDPEDYNTIVNALQKRTYSDGEQVIKQGDDGNEMYIVEKGTLNCTKSIEDGTEMQIRT